MAMTNTALKAFIDEYGERISAIVLNNNYKIYVGYKSSAVQSIADIEFKTVDGVDFYGTKHKDRTHNLVDVDDKYTHTNWHLTEYIETIIVMEEKYERFRVDPFTIA